MNPPTIFGREPAAFIGSVVTIVGLIVSAFLGQGFITDVQAGRVNDIATAIGQLFVAFLPLIATLLTRPLVTPVAAPKLQQGSTVTVTNADGTTVGRDTVSPSR